MVRRGRVAFVAEIGGRRLPTLVEAGRRPRALAEAGRETGTRVRGVVRNLDTPAAGADGVAFRAVFDDGREGVFFARRGRLTAVAATGDREPRGGGFRTFRVPTVAADQLVFRAELQGPSGAGGLYRAPLDGTTPASTVAVTGDPTPLGGAFVTFGAPAGNRSGTIAYTTTLTTSTTTSAVFQDSVR
jgi:hypothetical protein